jgi:RNA polymerase primary sigma factor
MQDGNDKSFTSFDEASASVNEELSLGTDLNDFFVDLESSPVELLEDRKEFEKKDEDSEDLADIDLSPGAIDKSNDSVRVYLREMGMVPLLTREGEIELAKRIERGQSAVLKALSRSHLVVQLIIDTKQNIERRDSRL